MAKTTGWRLKITADRPGTALDDATIVQQALNAALAALAAKGFVIVEQEAKTWTRKTEAAKEPTP